MRLGIFSFLLLSGCIGPAVDTCITLNDLKTLHCIPSDSKKPPFDRPLKAGDFVYSPEDWKTLFTWIENHRN